MQKTELNKSSACRELDILKNAKQSRVIAKYYVSCEDYGMCKSEILKYENACENTKDMMMMMMMTLPFATQKQEFLRICCCEREEREVHKQRRHSTTAAKAHIRSENRFQHTAECSVACPGKFFSPILIHIF